MNILSKKELGEIKSLYTRHGRKKSDCCIVEGIRCCGEVFRRVPELVQYTLICGDAAAALEIPGKVYPVSPELLRSLSATVQSQGILSVVKVPETTENATTKSPDAFIVALDKVGDPGNFGTICRTVLAAGLTELWYTKGSVDPFSDKVIRSGMGAQFSLKLRVFDDLEALRKRAKELGFSRICLTKVDRGENCFEAEALFEHSVVVIGSEGQGVSDLSGALEVNIPMPGKFESLNAAQAATIIIFEYVRRKTGGLL